MTGTTGCRGCPNYEVATDITVEAHIVIAVLTGRVPLDEALAALGYTRGQWAETLENQAESGQKGVQAAQREGFRWIDGFRENVEALAGGRS